MRIDANVDMNVEGSSGGLMRTLVEALESFLRRVPGSGPYMREIAEEIDRKFGPGSFRRFLDNGGMR